MSKRPFVLVICDGWGENPDDFGNAIRTAVTPHLDRIRDRWPHTAVAASGEAVGLPAGQIGNSEVGHLTIGTGRVTRQPLSRQHHEIASGNFDENEVLIGAIALGDGLPHGVELLLEWAAVYAEPRYAGEARREVIC